MDNEMQEGAASSAAAEPTLVSEIKDVNNNLITEKSTKLSTQPSPSSAQKSNSMISQHLNALEHLDKQHQHLRGVEQSLQKYLDELQKEEQSLRKALVQSSSTLKDQRETEKKKNEAEALARLEDALMNDDDDDSDSDSTAS
mmetsp:Transcript_8962/g.17847  ORF Transcript_8962/g.17847 Transcript_8962/m.17847 type:complete len:142 (-) Transcript_8962:2192-2617(-)